MKNKLCATAKILTKMVNLFKASGVSSDTV